MAVGGVNPIAFSLLGDLYAPERRTEIAAYVGLAGSVGIGAGQNLSGFLGPVVSGSCTNMNCSKPCNFT